MLRAAQHWTAPLAVGTCLLGSGHSAVRTVLALLCLQYDFELHPAYLEVSWIECLINTLLQNYDISTNVISLIGYFAYMRVIL